LWQDQVRFVANEFRGPDRPHVCGARVDRVLLTRWPTGRAADGTSTGIATAESRDNDRLNACGVQPASCSLANGSGSDRGLPHASPTTKSAVAIGSRWGSGERGVGSPLP
jgi:hypothetical protein